MMLHYVCIFYVFMKKKTALLQSTIVGEKVKNANPLLNERIDLTGPVRVITVRAVELPRADHCSAGRKYHYLPPEYLVLP